MLAQLLAVAVGLGSITLYLAAFFFPEVHRKHDFFWSGVGCFYALVLWADAGQISSTELLGHLASTALVAWFGWQTLNLRRKRTPRDLQTPLNDQSWQVFRRDITALGANWLQKTPFGKFIPKSLRETANRPVTEGEFRASSLKQVDYEFLDELPPDQVSHFKGKTPRSEGLPGSHRDAAKPGVPPDVYQPTATRKPEKRPTKITPQPPSSKPLTLLQKGGVLKNWLFEIVSTATKPKPQKPVIVIPPREAKSSNPRRDSPAGKDPQPVDPLSPLNPAGDDGDNIPGDSLDEAWDTSGEEETVDFQSIQPVLENLAGDDDRPDIPTTPEVEPRDGTQDP